MTPTNYIPFASFLKFYSTSSLLYLTKRRPSLPTTIPPRMWEAGLVGYVNAISDLISEKKKFVR